MVISKSKRFLIPQRLLTLRIAFYTPCKDSFPEPHQDTFSIIANSSYAVLNSPSCRSRRRINATCTLVQHFQTHGRSLLFFSSHKFYQLNLLYFRYIASFFFLKKKGLLYSVRWVKFLSMNSVGKNLPSTRLTITYF